MPLDAPVTIAVLPFSRSPLLIALPSCFVVNLTFWICFVSLWSATLTGPRSFVNVDRVMARESIATRERILGAAFVRFARYGFRRTSMEDIAGEAGVSRAALYLQFRNKEEIFKSLAQDLQSAALARAGAALEARGPLAERVRAAIEGKSLEMVRITLESPHGSELLDETNRLCGDLVADTERRFAEQLTRVLRRAAADGEIDLAAAELTAPAAAQLLLRAVKGLKGPGVTVEEFRTGLAALVRVFVAGLAARAKRGAAAPARATARSTAQRRRSTRASGARKA
jgi:AcrR family transcriptional regulator